MSWPVSLPALFSERLCVKLVLSLLILLFFSIQAFKAMYFPLSTALAIFHEFGHIVSLSFGLKIFF